MGSWREALFKPGHVVFFVYKASGIRETVASGIRILEAMPQQYEFSISLDASGETNDVLSDWRPQPTEFNNSIFYLDDKHVDELVHLMVGTDPLVKIFIRYQGEDYILRGTETNPTIDSSDWGWIQSPYYDPDPLTEMFGLHQLAEPTYTFRNDKPLDLTVKIRFIGMRYKFVALTKEEMDEVLKSKKFTVRVLGSIDRPIEYAGYDKVFKVAVPYKELMMEV